MIKKLKKQLQSVQIINIIIIAITIFFALIILNLPFKVKMYGDLDFHNESKIVSQVVWAKLPANTIAITKAPGPVLFYSIPYILAGPSATDNGLWIAGVLWNLLWLMIALILLKDTAFIIFGNIAGISAVLLAMLVPVHLYYGLGILAETMAFVGYGLFAYGTVKVFTSTIYHWKALWIVIAGFFFLVTARPNALLLLAIIPLFLIWYFWKKKNSGNFISFKKYSYAWVIACFIVFIFYIGIKSLPGNKVNASQESYFTFVAHLGRFQFRTETWDWRFWDNNIRSDSKDYIAWCKSSEELKIEMTNKGLSQNNVYGKWVLNDALTHPIMVAKQFFVRLLFGNFLQVSSIKPEKFKIGTIGGAWLFNSVFILVNLLNILILVSAIYFFVQYIKSKPYLIFLIAPVIALVIFHGFIYMEQRYLYPVRPFFLLMASPLLVKIYDKLLCKKP